MYYYLEEFKLSYLKKNTIVIVGVSVVVVVVVLIGVKEQFEP